ncbi:MULTISPECIES: 30S ribosomal protein S4 [unclassified Treponema]|uniref:30S ribosomal protein S4 n=1 Tax=unclassified Treponema TaxID=2638727 RepID=UPI0020A5141E|nr:MULTISPECIES: 30S ribosomal protein S4 [unclassified Treponema]UTC68296.1 30S ribosomal protein S4 [Treponema sp. OMZ 789]UTC71017.1 30S ribosomal protein S4 [Treponema sp. OMZ 790]UTC73758.1 30S ribosomal protein S4 [Treponema sp. OMZ 791]
MAIKQPKGKTVRRLGVNIYGNPKYDRLLDRKPNGPGKERGARKRGKTSVYGEQLKEKQKFRFAYGISERQFRNLYKKASRMPGVTGDNMISLMEQRLDNTIYRMGFAISRAQARQMVTHAYFFINGKPVNIPSMCVSVNDVITTKNKKGIQNLIRHNMSTSQNSRGSWLTIDDEKLSATVNILPVATDIQPVGNIQNVVEYYSRNA